MLVTRRADARFSGRQSCWEPQLSAARSVDAYLDQAMLRWLEPPVPLSDSRGLLSTLATVCTLCGCSTLPSPPWSVSCSTCSCRSQRGTGLTSTQSPLFTSGMLGKSQREAQWAISTDIRSHGCLLTLLSAQAVNKYCERGLPEDDARSRIQRIHSVCLLHLRRKQALTTVPQCPIPCVIPGRQLGGTPHHVFARHMGLPAMYPGKRCACSQAVSQRDQRSSL